MIYSLNINTPENITYEKRQLKRMYVTKGLVYQVEVFFPAGSHGLLHCFIMDGGFQCWPSNPGETFSGNDILITFGDTYIKQSEPFIFDIYTYNLDDTFDHSLSVRIGLVSADVFIARFLPTVAYDLLAGKLKELEAEQLAEQETIFNESMKQPLSWIT